MMKNQHGVPSQRQASLTAGQQKAQGRKATKGKQSAYLFDQPIPLQAAWLGFLLAHTSDISQYYGQIARYLLSGGE